MAHDTKNLTVRPTACTFGSGQDKILHCAENITADPVATVAAAGYFNASAKRLPKGTIINCVCDAATTPVLRAYVVTANTGTVVTIAPQNVA